MALFNWFSGKSNSIKKAQQPGSAPLAKHASAGQDALQTALAASSRPAPDAVNRSEVRKAKRHVRREQLYSAIRQAMTRAGVLSASFKFKVLSLDQRGDQFLVMMDMHPSLGLPEKKLADSEALIIDTAKSQFEILVTAVYWRVDAAAEPGGLNASGFHSKPAPLTSTPASLPVPHAMPTPMPIPSAKKPVTRFEPIEDDEVTAFKHALAASAEHHPAALDTAGKNRSGLRSFTLITGFEDTEMSESAAVPALSATQYGDLN